MLTNHNTQLINELYKDFYRIPIQTNRNINSKGNDRKNKGDEIIIMNYLNNNFSKFLSTLETTNLELNDLVDVDKIIKDIDKVEMKLHSLDYIISNDKQDVLNRIKKLYNNNADVFSILPLLVACDFNKELKIKFEIKQIVELTKKLEDIIYFFESTKLIDFIVLGKIKNFTDYLTGVKVGMDTNARKNRVGTKNEKDIEKIIMNNLSQYPELEISFQVKKIEIFKSLPKVFNKKFDAVIKNTKNNKIVLLEASYYNTQGSKVSETSRAYKDIFKEVQKYQEKYNFVWVIDGNGTKSIQKILEDDFQSNYIYNKSNFIQHIKNILELK